MLKIQKLKIFTLLLLVAGFAALSQSRAYAWNGLPVNQADGQKIINFCAKQLKIPNTSQGSALFGCAYGYTLAIGGQKASDCDSKFKHDDKAAKACKDPGFSEGKSDPLNIKAKTKPPSGGGCAGSDCSATPTGNGHNCDENQCDLITLYINPIIKVLTVIVGLVVAASLVLGGVQYSAAGGDPQKVSAAKSRISNTLLAFFAYAFLYAFLNFLIPGGVFR